MIYRYKSPFNFIYIRLNGAFLKNAPQKGITSVLYPNSTILRKSATQTTRLRKTHNILYRPQTPPHYQESAARNSSIFFPLPSLYSSKEKHSKPPQKRPNGHSIFFGRAGWNRTSIVSLEGISPIR